MGWFEACFAGLPDPRTGDALRHELLEILTIALTMQGLAGDQHAGQIEALQQGARRGDLVLARGERRRGPAPAGAGRQRP